MSAVPSIRATVSEVDRELPLSNIQTMEEVVDENVHGPRFRFAVVLSFTALAVGLAGLGIYGVVAQWTAARRREIGVRMAQRRRDAATSEANPLQRLSQASEGGPLQSRALA